MTGRVVVFDTWAWMEILAGSAAGDRLRARFLDDEGLQILTLDITLAEVAGRLAAAGAGDLIPETVDRIVDASTAVVAISRDDAVRAGPLRGELRKIAKDASLADAILLSVARNRDATLVSCDPAFRGLPDVHCEA